MLTLMREHATHRNPVRRGLWQRAEDWRWSSARRYADATYHDAELPTIHGLSVEFLVT
jgi:hypothetical protein